MTEVVECRHGSDVPEACIPCGRESGRAWGFVDEPPDVGPVFIARFDGDCPRCDDGISAGDQARVVDGRANCRDCADRLVTTMTGGR